MIYSGLPNPFYYLEDQGSINTLNLLIGEAEKNPISFDKSPVIPAQLGYAGL